MINPLRLAWISALAFMACTTDVPPKKDKIEPVSPQTSLSVGDTSSHWVASKTVLLPNGSIDTRVPYTAFELSSSDPTVASVVAGQFLLGLKAGQTQVKVHDENSNLVSDPVTVVVTE